MIHERDGEDSSQRDFGDQDGAGAEGNCQAASIPLGVRHQILLSPVRGCPGWFLSLASIFVIRQSKDAFSALSSAVALCRDRIGPVAAVGTWFGLAHLVLFMVATSVVTFPLAFVRVLPIGFVLFSVLFLTLLYFAMVDALYVGRLAGYVAILEAPPVAESAPALLSAAQAIAPSTQHSALSMQSETGTVDQSELILSDLSERAPEPLYSKSSKANIPLDYGRVDQDEPILSDNPSSDPPGKSNQP